MDTLKQKIDIRNGYITAKIDHSFTSQQKTLCNNCTGQ